MSVFLGSNQRYAVAKAEVTPGTMVTPGASDFDIRMYDVQIEPKIDFDDENSKFATGDHGEDESIAGGQTVTIKFKTKLLYGSTAATAPKQAKLWKACGLKSSAYTTTGIGYLGRKEYDDQTITIWVYDQERGGAAPVTTIYKAAGCIGNMMIKADNINSPWVCEYTFTGKLVDIVDGSAVTLTSPDYTLGEKFVANAFTIGGTAKLISSFQFDLGNEIVPVIDQSDSTGYQCFAIGSRKPRFSCNPLAVKQATDDWLATELAQTTSIISLATAASTPHFTLKIPAAQLIQNNLASREGLVAWERNYRCLRNGNYNPNPDTTLTAEDTFELLQGSRT